MRTGSARKNLLIIPMAILPMLINSPARCGEPPLPPGLEGDTGKRNGEPPLPAGLGAVGEKDRDTPPLPAGLEGTPQDPDRQESALAREPSTSPLDLHGFAEIRAGLRTENDPHEPDRSIAETRLQIEHEHPAAGLVFHGRLDLVYDDLRDDHDINLDQGEGWLDLREASVLLRPTSFLDLTLGRQILTWGVGDLLFLNDLFPKDWNSFFLGRDVEYLKAPSDAIKASFFFQPANLDIVYTPEFDADRFIDGTAVSYYSDQQGELVGRNAVVQVEERDNWFSDDELALRVHRTLAAYEFALYGYDGFWKSPAGVDPSTGRATFPELTVYGASVRGPAAEGIASTELSYYRSGSDSSGADPSVRNSEWRWLLGYSWEVSRNFNADLQYYLEYMLDHDEYLNTLPSGIPAKDEDRHVVTLRLTRLLLNQNLTLSFFGFWSPSDQDGYLRPSASYKIDDRWNASLGGNLFFGDEQHTFFGQFEKNSNIYGSLRFSY